MTVLSTEHVGTRLDARAVSFIPATGKFYHGAIGADMDISGRREQEYHPIAKWNKQAALQGDAENVLTILDVESYRQMERLHQAGNWNMYRDINKQAALDATSLANITRVELSTAIINELYKEVFLHLAANFIPVPKLKYDYDVILHMKTRGKKSLVGKRQKSQAEAPEFVQTQFDLATYGKLQRLIDIPDEDELTALLSPTKHMISDVTQVISQDINMLILEDGLEQFKAITSGLGSWSALATNGNLSAHNPLNHIAAQRKRITKNHGRINTMVMNSVTYAHMVSNTYIRGYESMLKQEQPGRFTFAKLPGMDFIIDEDVDDGVVYIIDRRAMTVGDGPMVTEAFRDPKEGVSGHVVRKWIQPKVNDTLASAFGSKLSGL